MGKRITKKLSEMDPLDRPSKGFLRMLRARHREKTITPRLLTKYLRIFCDRNYIHRKSFLQFILSRNFLTPEGDRFIINYDYVDWRYGDP